jgi:hypothetical protein
VIALPKELTSEQNEKLVEDLVGHLAPAKPYTVAIHQPQAAIADGNQPHAHVMVNQRMLDGLPRTAEQHFRRFNARSPETGGCKKDSGGRHPLVLKAELKATRALVADVQNQHLMAAGEEARVDHRSHRDRGIDKVPERHLGQHGVRSLKADEREAILAARTASKGG